MNEILQITTELLQNGIIQHCNEKTAQYEKETILSEIDIIENIQTSSTKLIHSDFSFFHDKIHESIYTSLDNNKKINIHYKLSKVLIKLLKERNFNLFNEENIKNQQNIKLNGKEGFILHEILRHIELGKERIENYNEAKEIVILCHYGCENSKQLGNSINTNKYANFAKKLLFQFKDEKQCWIDEYELIKSIYICICDTGSNCKELNENNQILLDDFEKLFFYIKKPIDRLEIYKIYVSYFNSLNQFQNSLQIALKALNEFNFPLSTEITIDDFNNDLNDFQNSIKTKNSSKSIQEIILNLSISKDKFYIQLLEFIVFCSHITYLAGSFPLYCTLLLLSTKIT